MTTHIHITGDKSAFVSKAAIDRFRTDLREKKTLPHEKYLKEGWSYLITSSTENEIQVSLSYIPPVNIEKNKTFLKLRLNEMKNKRMSEDQIRLKMGKDIPSELTQQYIDLKKLSSVPILHPNDVIKSAAQYKPILEQLLKSYGSAGNPYAVYYQSLLSHISKPTSTTS